MKLFKNRGDIYFSKSSVNSSKQAKVLYSLLAVIVIFTVVFVVLLSRKYSTVADFFAQGEVTTTEISGEVIEEVYPNISGKTNYLVLETDDAQSELHYIFLIQADKDNLAYKSAALPVNMTVDGESIFDIFSVGGGAALQKSLTEYFGFEIDYQITFTSSSFVEFANKMGSLVYTSNSEIIFSGGEGDDKYSINIEEGEQKISGRDINNLLRYYACETKNYTAENELILKVFTGLFNAENYEKSESLFRMFIKSCTTDITVRDFENGKNALMVFCNKNADVTLYSALASDEGGELTQESVKEIKGYFSK